MDDEFFISSDNLTTYLCLLSYLEGCLRLYVRALFWVSTPFVGLSKKKLDKMSGLLIISDDEIVIK